MIRVLICDDQAIIRDGLEMMLRLERDLTVVGQAQDGAKAVELIEQGSFGRMVSYQQYQVGDVSIEEAVNQLRLVKSDSEIVNAGRSIGICFGDCPVKR